MFSLRFKDIGRYLIPEKIYKFKYKEELSKIYEKLYFDNIHYSLITIMFFLSFFLSIIAYFFAYDYIYKYFNGYFDTLYSKFLIICISWAIINFLVYYTILLFFFFFHEEKFKTNTLTIEKDLPEFIDNLVSNLKGGVSLEKALVKSVRAEQKVLLSEVVLINQKIMMGTDVYDALKSFRMRFKNSQIINRTFFLIEEGIKGGGNIAEPLEKISNNLKRIYNLNKEIVGSSGGFAIVIRAISIVIAPLLFALAITLLSFIGELFKLLKNSGMQAIAVNQIEPAYYFYLKVFSYSMIVLITFFSSMITSTLKNERTYDALKYMPVYFLVGILLFKYISSFLIKFFMGIF